MELSVPAGYRLTASNTTMSMSSTFSITKVTGIAPEKVTSGGHAQPSANGQVVVTTGSTEDERPKSRAHLRLVRD